MKRKAVHINAGRILLLSAIAAAAASTLCGIAGWRRGVQRTRCADVRICILDSADNRYISSAEVKRYLDREFGGCRNRFADRLELEKIEEVLQGCLFLQEHEAFVTPDGILHIEVTQRTPVAKLRRDGANYYMDESGKTFKVDDDWCRSVLTIYGDSPLDDPQWCARVASMMEWLQESTKWNGRVETVHSDGKGQLRLNLKDRKEVFILGEPTQVKDKFDRIDTFLNEIVPVLEEGKSYRSVNLKYNNQIVCKE